MILCGVCGENKMVNESSLEVIIEWDEKLPYEDSSIEFYNIIVNVVNPPEKFKQHYNGRLRAADVAENFVVSLMRSVEQNKRYDNKMVTIGIGHGTSHCGARLKDPDSEKRGRKTFVIPFSAQKSYSFSLIGGVYGDFGLLGNLDCLEEFRFIAPRNETVNHNDYCSFFGSSGGLWLPSSYPRGDFVETIEQTIYEMQHDHPTIFRWTNVPRMGMLEKQRSIDTKFDALVEERVAPKDKESYDLECKTIDNPTKKRVKELIKILEECAAPVRQYKQERGIIRL